MRGRSLAVLALVVAALGAFVWFYERRLPSSAEREERADRLLGVEAEDVRELELAWDGGRVLLAREEGDEASGALPEWRLVEPLAARADGTAADGLVRALVGLRSRRSVADADPAEHGLAPPRLTVTLRTADDEQVVEVGEQVPASEDRLARLAGSGEVHVVSGAFFADATREPGDWRSRDLFAAGRQEIERLRLVAPGREVLLARRGDGFWLESPVVDAADPELVDALVGDLAGLRAERFLDEPEEPEAELGLAPPAYVVEAVLTGREEPFRAAIGGVVEGGESRWATVGGQRVVVGPALLAHLDRAPEEWRSRAWTGLPAYQVDGIEVRQGEERTVLTRSGADWRRGEDEILYTPVSRLLAAVTEARAERLLSPPEAAAEGWTMGGDGEVEITLTRDDGTQTVVRLGRERDGLAPAAVAGREAVLLLPAAAAEEVREAIAEVRAAEPLVATPGERES